MSLSFPTAPTVGQTYQGWVWNGNAWDPNYAANFVTSIMGKSGALSQGQAVGPGNRVLLMSNVVSSAVASVGMFYNFTNAYDQYEFDIYDLMNDTTATPGLRLSFDGSTWNSTGNYAYAVSYATSGAAGGGTGAGASYIPLGSSIAPAASQAAEFRIKFSLPWTTDRSKVFFYDSGFLQPVLYWTAGAGSLYSILSPIKGLQIVMTAGNITRGVFNLYGLGKAGAGGS